MKRDARVTRQRLLRAAFEEMHRVGYRAAEMGRILGRAGVTKGALYHHFPSKRALGYAVIDEILRDWILERWLRPLQGAEDPLAALAALARWGERTASPGELALGCPLNGLSQELCGVDEGFGTRLTAVYDAWHDGLSELLTAARARGVLRADLDCAAAATFIIAAWEGAIGLGKVQVSSDTLRRCRQGLEIFLESLRPAVGKSETPFE